MSVLECCIKCRIFISWPWTQVITHGVDILLKLRHRHRLSKGLKTKTTKTKEQTLITK